VRCRVIVASALKRWFPSGNSDLEEPLAIRPTSETAMYPCQYIQSFVHKLLLITRLRLRQVD
jgi:hypothetical protein